MRFVEIPVSINNMKTPKQGSLNETQFAQLTMFAEKIGGRISVTYLPMNLPAGV
jgi:hypothetical protein